MPTIAWVHLNTFLFITRGFCLRLDEVDENLTVSFSSSPHVHYRTEAQTDVSLCKQT